MKSNTKTDHLVATATNCKHGLMPPRTSQRTFRLNEQQAQMWEDALAQSGLSQQKAVETLVEALGAELIPSLIELRAELFRKARDARK
ncbi:hypothetical protein [Nocardia paucivorans]|uniref:hypothetical protein n=1 Tax=Nocardia paucivorans TaxID=114259 RepID=UPI00059508AB|nr:hypothetical protein [Nocardia paucivorans]